jgi:hypothetical protein
VLHEQRKKTKALLDVAQKRNTTHDPLLRGHVGSELDHGHELKICAPGLAVDGAFCGSETEKSRRRQTVELLVTLAGGVDGKEVDERQGSMKHLRGGIAELAVAAVPAGTLKEEPVDVDTFLRWSCGVLLRVELCHFVSKDDTVQSPALVCTRDLLSHGCDESLGVEEAGHPEVVRTTIKAPRVELSMTLDLMC